MTDPEFENELRERLRRAAEFTGDPSSAPETDLTAPAGGGQRPVQPAARLAGVAVILVIAVGGTILALRSDPGEVVTTDDPIDETTSAPPVADPVASELAAPEDVAFPPTSLAGLLEPDTVRIMASAPIAGRVAPAYTWTGTELLIWGGSQPRSGGGEDPLSDGAAYDPVADSWRLVSEAPIVGRAYPAVAWTGTEMIIWGGSSNGAFLDDGAAYNPVSDTWRRLSDSPLDGAMKSGVVWTGEELIIVGGLNGDSSGAAYNPDSDSWRQLPDAPSLITPPYPQAVWTGERAYFALSSRDVLGDLVFAAYDPATDTWETIPHQFLASALPFLVWTGTEIVGVTTAVGLTQAAYDPAADDWRQLPAVPNGLVRSVTATPLPWTGQQILLWSGGASGLALDVATGQWRNYPAGDLDNRGDGVLVWADGVLLSWGGSVPQPDGTAVGANDGMVYSPPNTTASSTPGTGVLDTDVGATMILDDGFDGVIVVDLDARTATRMPMGGSAGDQPYRLWRTGNSLITGWGNISVARFPRLQPEPLGEATIFVPSPRDGAVWLIDYPGGRIGDGAPTYRLVDVGGETLIAVDGPDPLIGFPAMGYAGGMVIETGSGLLLWPTDVGESIPLTAGEPAPGFAADTTETQVAWCAGRCPELILTDTSSLDVFTIDPPTENTVYAARSARFSPDGNTLAAIALDRTTFEPTHLVLVDTATGEIRRQLDIASLEATFVALSWRDDSSDLFFFATTGTPDRVIGRVRPDGQLDTGTVPFGSALANVVVDRDLIDLGELDVVAAEDCSAPSIQPSGRDTSCTFRF